MLPSELNIPPTSGVPDPEKSPAPSFEPNDPPAPDDEPGDEPSQTG
jgi:hypothetical protein